MMTKFQTEMDKLADEYSDSAPKYGGVLESAFYDGAEAAQEYLNIEIESLRAKLDLAVGALKKIENEIKKVDYETKI